MKEFLSELLKSRLQPQQWNWLQDSLGKVSGNASSGALQRCYTEASRRVGKVALQLTGQEKQGLKNLNNLLYLDQWGADEAARVLLLLAAASGTPKEYEQNALDCYELGDSREQQSWLRGLSLLPGCERFLQTAVDSCRTNIIPLFESIACENPYPSLYFPELNFNQMVLKCLFNRIELRRIAGLEARLNPEMARMATHYAEERTAAGRDVPPDIWMTGAPRPERINR